MWTSLKSGTWTLPLIGMLLCMACAGPAQAQPPNEKPSDLGIKSKKALKYYQNGRKQAEYRDYKRAIQEYEAAIAEEPEFGMAWFHKGGSHYAMQEYAEALAALEKAQSYLQGDPPVMMYFYLAECALFRDEFELAYNNYDAFLKAEPRVARNIIQKAQKSLESTRYAKEAVKTNTITFSPENLGENINSQYEEYLPYLTADGSTIFFTARRPDCIGGYNPQYRGFTEDFYFSEFKDGAWQNAVNLGAPVNTEMNEGAASFSPDGQYVFFTACHREDGYGDCDIFVSKLDGKTWLPPQNLGPIVNTPGWESQPCISNDGKTLFFASTRPGGQGGQDIWYTRMVNGRWTEPVNMGPQINTEGSELSPFLHADGQTLYFASDKHPGFGSLDLFVTKRVGDEWTQPENLGYPLNTSAAEGNIFVVPEGNRGYINSSREGGMGKSDIYTFELDPKIRPSYTTYVRGFVTDKDNGKPLAAKVTLINLESRDTIRAVQTNKATGKFLLTLPLDQDYAAFVDKQGYLFASQFFSLKGVDPQTTPYFDVKIELDPLGEGKEVVMSSIFYATNKFALLDNSKAELEHLVQFMKLNPSVKVEIQGHTDDVGSTSDNMVLSQNRAGEVKKYLESRGIKADRVLAKGYGEGKPIMTNATAEGRAMNRRTVCRIVGL